MQSSSFPSPEYSARTRIYNSQREEPQLWKEAIQNFRQENEEEGFEDYQESTSNAKRKMPEEHGIGGVRQNPSSLTTKERIENLVRQVFKNASPEIQKEVFEYLLQKKEKSLHTFLLKIDLGKMRSADQKNAKLGKELKEVRQQLKLTMQLLSCQIAFLHDRPIQTARNYGMVAQPMPVRGNYNYSPEELEAMKKNQEAYAKAEAQKGEATIALNQAAETLKQRRGTCHSLLYSLLTNLMTTANYAMAQGSFEHALAQKHEAEAAYQKALEYAIQNQVYLGNDMDSALNQFKAMQIQ